MSGRSTDGQALSPPPERSREIDYGHRHFVNLAAAAVLLMLALGMVWTFKSIDEQERMRRCIGSGRKDCVTILAPPRGMIQPVR
ncbi:MAG: hypothetical protein JWN93_1052 [Hyphomicrobiales bacterium]|nr:hypothetical protein [Hyphomicrobiales bacterium]